jgi:hypothetical protein
MIIPFTEIAVASSASIGISQREYGQNNMSIRRLLIHSFGRLPQAAGNWRRLAPRVCLAVLIAAAGKPFHCRADDPKLLVDFNVDPRNLTFDSAGLLFQANKPDPQPPFAEVRQLAYELTTGHIPATPQPAKPPRQPAADFPYPWPTAIPPPIQQSILPPAIFAPAGNLQPITMHSRASQQAELLPGLPSQAASFPASNGPGNVAAGGQLATAKLLSPDQQPASSGTSPTLASQLNHYLTASDTAQSSANVGTVFPMISLDSVSETMVDDDTIKTTLGGSSGFFSAARLAWNYNGLRLESGIGYSWTSWLDRNKSLLDFSNRENVVWNLSVLYYPLGEIPWRPFVLLGTGLSQLNTFGNTTQENSATVYTGITHKN